MTSFYMFRLWFKTFFGEERFEEHHATPAASRMRPGHGHGVHESPLIMTLPLMILALLSIIGGWVGVPEAPRRTRRDRRLPRPCLRRRQRTGHRSRQPRHRARPRRGLRPRRTPRPLHRLPSSTTRSPEPPLRTPDSSPLLYRLVENKFYVDEIYQAVIVTPLLIFARIVLSLIVDGGLVNGSGATAGASARGLGLLARRIQSGNIRSYAGWLALGAAAVIAVMIFGHTLVELILVVIPQDLLLY